MMNPEKTLSSSRFKNMDHDSINKNPLNTSTSKMLYSFPKSNRFSQQNKSFSSNKLYDLPTTKTMRATSFGYGNKTDLAKKSFISPSPDRYNVDNTFRRIPSNAITMAPGRGDVKANDFFYRPLKQSPQPATYTPRPLDKSLKFSIYKKLEDSTHKWKKFVPGPGAYSYLDLTAKAKSPIAKYSSVTSGKFDNLPRLSEVEMKKNNTPGPNQYKNSSEISNNVRYQKRAGNTFSKGARQGITQKSITPGPGIYKSFSQFC